MGSSSRYALSKSEDGVPPIYEAACGGLNAQDICGARFTSSPIRHVDGVGVGVGVDVGVGVGLGAAVGVGVFLPRPPNIAAPEAEPTTSEYHSSLSNADPAACQNPFAGAGIGKSRLGLTRVNKAYALPEVRKGNVGFSKILYQLQRPARTHCQC
jgi:hypothetical protein